jgi:CBS domain-containing protein
MAALAVRDVMIPNPITLDKSSPATEAARVMRDQNTGAIIVTEGGEDLRGVVTDRDIVIRAIAENRNPADVPLAEICSEEQLATVSPDDEADRAVELMRERHIRRLPVVEKGRAVGIVSLGDLAVDRDGHSALAEISAAPANR